MFPQDVQWLLLLSARTLLAPIDAFLASMPRSIHLDVHIDDFVVGCEGKPRDIVRDLAHAQSVLKLTIEHDLGCPISLPEAGLAAIVDVLGRELRIAIGEFAGKPTIVMANLCTDAAAGPKRCKWMNSATGSTIRTRFRKAVCWKSRLRALKEAIVAKAAKVAKAGITPAMT